MEKFEYFPIKCRTDRAGDSYKRNHPESISPEINGTLNAESSPKRSNKKLKSKVLERYCFDLRS
jgi:hypothetical protein